MMVMMISITTTSARTPITIRVICHSIRCGSVRVFGTSKIKNVAVVDISKVTWTCTLQNIFADARKTYQEGISDDVR